MRCFLITICLIIFGYLHADEFVVRSFKADPADLSAIQYAYLDVNDEKCAIIKVRTDLRNLYFDSGKNLAKDVEFKNGEYWLYVSPGEKLLSVIKDGFITLHYSIEIPIRSSRVYILELTNKDKGSAATGSMIINTMPQGATVKIQELSGLDFKTPAKLLNYPAFPYSISISKNRYKTLDTILAIHPVETITHNLTLVPQWGNLVITVNPVDAEIYLDGEYFGTGSQELKSEESGILIGTHKFSVVKDKYYSEEKTVEITRGNNGTLEFSLRPRTGYLRFGVSPEGATVLVNGEEITGMPYADSLLIGTYEIEISHPGYLGVKKNVEIKENEHIEFFEELKHTRQVRITSSPSGADIYLRGNYMGTTPENILLTYGTNSITLKKRNFEDIDRRIDVTENTDRFEFSLEPARYAVTINSVPEGAGVYLNNQRLEETPANLKLPYGTYHLKLEKRGYFRKRKTIKVSFNNQNFGFRLKSLKHVRFGIVRGADSWGGEITYVEDLFGLTLGYFQPPKADFDHPINFKNIDPGDYYDLNTGNPVGKHSNGDSASFKIIGKGHIFFNKAPTVSVVLGFAMGKIHYSDVYMADADYENISTGDHIHRGQYFSIAREGTFKVSPILGVSWRILRYFYVGAEYWFLTEKGSVPFVTGGICYPLR